MLPCSLSAGRVMPNILTKVPNYILRLGRLIQDYFEIGQILSQKIFKVYTIAILGSIALLLTAMFFEQSTWLERI